MGTDGFPGGGLSVLGFALYIFYFFYSAASLIFPISLMYSERLMMHLSSIPLTLLFSFLFDLLFYIFLPLSEFRRGCKLAFSFDV